MHCADVAAPSSMDTGLHFRNNFYLPNVELTWVRNGETGRRIGHLGAAPQGAVLHLWVLFLFPVGDVGRCNVAASAGARNGDEEHQSAVSFNLRNRHCSLSGSSRRCADTVPPSCMMCLVKQTKRQTEGGSAIWRCTCGSPPSLSTRAARAHGWRKEGGTAAASTGGKKASRDETSFLTE